MSRLIGNSSIKYFHHFPKEGTKPHIHSSDYGSYQLNEVTDEDVMLLYFTILPEHRRRGHAHGLINHVLNNPTTRGKLIHLVAGNYKPYGEAHDPYALDTNQLCDFYSNHGFETIRFIPDWGYYMVKTGD